MKINTDGTLLGALSSAVEPKSILDIGAGTGVVALMLAQRFPDARIDAVEIEAQAAERALHNFESSDFAARLQLYPLSFQELSLHYPEKQYDLIVSNPPFFVNALKNPDLKKQTARHSDNKFFSELISFISNHLSASGVCTLILPPATSLIVKELAREKQLFVSGVTHIRSFAQSEIHRELVTFCREIVTPEVSEFVIYSTQKKYSVQFVNSLKEFFTIF